jgi:hypothetical protein
VKINVAGQQPQPRVSVEHWAHPGRDVITPEPARRGGGAIGESSRRCQRCCRLSAAVLETRHATCDLRPATWSRSTACPCQTAHFFSHDAQPLPRGCRHLPKTLQRRKDDPECPIDSRGGSGLGSGLSSAGGATTLRSWPISTSPRHATPRHATPHMVLAQRSCPTSTSTSSSDGMLTRARGAGSWRDQHDQGERL